MTRHELLRLAKEANLTTLRFPAVELTAEDIAELAACSVNWLEMSQVKTQASWKPQLHGTRIKRISLSMEYASDILNSETPVQRANKLRIAFGPTGSNEELPGNPWPDAISVEGFTSGGIYFAPVEPDQ